MTQVDCTKIINNLQESIKLAITKIYSKQSYTLSILVTNENSELYNQLNFLTDELSIDDYKIKLEKIVDLTNIKENIFSKITTLNDEEQVGGIYIDDLNLELSNYESIIYSMVHPSKDVSALNVVNTGLLFYDQQLILPPYVSTIIKLFEENKIHIMGQHIVILNQNTQFIKALLMILLQKNANISILDPNMKDIKKILKQASIIISAYDQPNSLYAKNFKKDTILFDVGSTYNTKGNLILEDTDNISQYFSPDDLSQINLLFILYNFLRVVFFNHKEQFEEN